MSELLTKIEEAGIRVYKGDATSTLTVLPHYMNNGGFFHIKTESWETVFVKGVYKDNIRHIKGESPYDTRKLNELAQTLSDVERALRQPAILTIYFDEELTYHVVKAEPFEHTAFVKDRRNPSIPSPITKVEKSLGKGDMTYDKHLFSKSPFAEIFPETLSPLTMSLSTGMPDVFNPLFISSSIKTQSPSINLLFGRLYMNVANIETIVSTFSQPTDFFMLNYAQSIFKTIKKPSIGIPNDSDLQIGDEEILEAIRDIKESTSQIKPEDIYSESFIELIALSVMTWEMVFIRLWKSFTQVHKLIGKDIGDTLQHIYMTRSDSILNTDFESFQHFFDPAFAPSRVEGCNLSHTSMEDMYKSFPAGKRLTTNKGKYVERIANAHKYLHMRDELYIAISELTKTLRNILLSTGEQLIANSMITDVNDIFYLEMSEIKNIIGDEFYGNLPFTINFRKWQNSRFAAICLPYNIYEKDVENADSIASSQIEKSRSEKKIPAMSFFHKELSTKDYSASISYQLCDLKGLENKDAVIAESAGLFSFLTEYCAVKGKPLYTGARFANLLLQDQIITTAENSISFQQEI